MTLPHGFGRRRDWNDEPRDVETHRCKLGSRCSAEYGSRKCKTHEWIYRHDEAWTGIRIGLVLGGIIALLFVGLEYNWQVNEVPAREIINGYNCGQLAEYVADKSTAYEYAEHRYEWLCVNEQIKEFQG